MQLGKKDTEANANAKVRTHSTSLASTVRTVSAFAVCGFAWRTYLVPTIPKQQMAVKAIMIEAGMPNGTSSAYSKAVDNVVAEIATIHGLPESAGGGAFWNEWHACKTANCMEDIICEVIQKIVRTNSISTISQLFEYCGVQYGRTAPHVAPHTPNENKETILSRAFGQNLDDQKWLVRELVKKGLDT